MNKKQQLIYLLNKILENCGDSRGRDGEFIDIDVKEAIELVEKLEVNEIL